MNDKLLGMLGLAVRAGKISFGVFMTEKLVEEGKARLVIAASDIGASNKRRLEQNAAMQAFALYIIRTKKISAAQSGVKTPRQSELRTRVTEAIREIFGGVAK